MRASCVKGDPGYANWVRHRPLKVFLDGRLVPNAVTADEEAGEIVVRAIDESTGKIKRNDAFEVMNQTLHGQVRIEVSR